MVNHRVRIGRNCNISHGVTLGQANRGRRTGVPVIGDGVYIGPGAKVVGAVTVGDNVAIGANCVVVDDVPDNAVVAGVPGRPPPSAAWRGSSTAAAQVCWSRRPIAMRSSRRFYGSATTSSCASVSCAAAGPWPRT